MNVRMMGRVCLVSLACLAITACVGVASNTAPNINPATRGVASLDAQSWYILWGHNMPEHPTVVGTGWSFTFPGDSGSVHYVQTPFQATTTPSRLTITFRIDASSDAVFNGAVDPAAGNPATFHLFFQRKDDDFMHPSYRWWADSGAFTLESTDGHDITISVPINCEVWSDVYGGHDPAAFAEALHNVAWFGMTFGGQHSWGHGVNMSSGAAQFTLLDYRVE